MNDHILTLYAFLQASRGSWRNALWIECKFCPYENRKCAGYLLTTDRDGRPVLFPVEQFRQLTGDMPDKDECAAVLDRSAFEELYFGWLLWHTDQPKGCCLRQLEKIKEYAL